MAETPHTGMGTILGRGNGASPESFIPIMGIKSFTGPNISRDKHDTTDMNQPDNYRRFIGGLVTAGELGFEANLLLADPTQNQEDGGFMAEFDKSSCDSLTNWQLLVPACEGAPQLELTFAGIVTGQGMQIPMDDLMSFAGTITISGRPNLAIVT